ncbi:MAG: CotH kinase family protein [Bacilli bacterium]|nr:CotH kinase family protein [Bacilli bacterium]
MKKIFQKLTFLAVPFMVVGCAGIVNTSTSAVDSNSSKNPASTTSVAPSSTSKSTSTISTSSGVHVHDWATEWTSDQNNHWHACKDCNEKKDSAAHSFGEWKTESLGTKLNDARFNLSTIKYRECSVCHYEQIDSQQAVLPEIRFDFDKNDPNANFATVARSTDTTRPKVNGKLRITNAGDKNTANPHTNVDIKVRGNQTAGFDKKGFQLKFNSAKVNLLGLNGGKKFKKWVLLADAKDTTVSRTALGLTMAKGVISADSNVWSSDFTPVSVYLNDQYWGMYMLAEQKEVKKGRIKLDEPEDENENPIMTTDIGYCFELDYYARNESAKGADGDPTFSIDYGNYFKSSDYKIESCLANSGLGLVKTYTMNSDINDGPDGSYVTDANSNQVKFIKNRLQALFNVLGEAAKNKTAKDINDNNQVVSTSLSIKQTIEKNFDLNAWAEGFIINAVCLPPDVGYSSFYMSYNNAPNGDKKLRFDNPWDFDSNFGNRRNFIEKPDTASSSGGGGWGGQSSSYDPYFMDRTANMWLQLLGKLDFFMNDYVKPKWNAARENGTFENMISLANTFYKYYDGEYTKNFAKWTTTQASDSNVASYFNGDGVNSGELRKPFVNVNERKDAQKETLNWLTKRVNYLESKWAPEKNRTPLETIK